MKMLVSLGANPAGGLEAALKFYHKEIVELLIQFGAAKKVSLNFFFLSGYYFIQMTMHSTPKFADY